MRSTQPIGRINWKSSKYSAGVLQTIADNKMSPPEKEVSKVKCHTNNAS